MNTKSTGLLLAAAALLFAFIYFVERPLRQAALLPLNHSVLPELDPAKITAVEIQVGGRGAHVIRAGKTNQLWQLTKPASYPANGPVIEKLLQELAQWTWQSSIDHPDSWDQYGLMDQDQFTLLLQENGHDRALKIGRISPVGDKVYLNVRGSDQILVAGPGVLNWIPTSDLSWRDLTVLNLNGTPFQRIQVGSTMELEWDAANHLWKMTKPIEARADTLKINQWLGQLQTLQVRGFVPDNTQELDPSGVPGPPQTRQLVLTFLRDAGETNKALELQAGNSPPGHTNWAYARRLYPPGLIAIDKAPLLPWEGDWTNFLDRHLLSVSPDLIGSIEVEGRDIEKFTVQKNADGTWRVTAANGETFPADELLMKEWLSALTNIQVADIGRSPVADKSPYGLDNPATALLHYQLFYARPAGQTNQLMTDLLFGRGTNQPAGLFEMGNDKKYVNTIDLAQFIRLANAYWQLRDLAVWHFESNQVVAIDIQQQGGFLRLVRDARNQWTLPAPRYGVEIVPSAIDEALYQVGRLHANYWSGYGDDHLERFGFDETDYRISFEINRNGNMETNTIQFGKASPLFHPYASVVRDGRRLIFEFPIDLYAGLVTRYLSIPQAYRHPR